jgi:signal transduction histidine kinase
MPAKGRYLLTAFAFFCCQVLAAQEFPFIQYTPKDGLVNSRVRKVYQDSKGRLYFLTFGGLSVYDGARFKNYTKETGLAIDMVNDVLEIGNDSFLVATNTNQLNILVGGEMKMFSTADNFYPVVNHFLKSEDGNIYVTTDEGLYIFKGNKFEHLDFPMRIHENWAPFLGEITEWKDYLVFTTNDLRGNAGLYLFDKKKRQLADAIIGQFISSLEKDKSGNVWVSLKNRISCLDTLSLMNGRLKFDARVSPFSAVSYFPGISMAFDNHHAWIIYKSKEIIRVGDDRSLLRFSLPAQYSVFDIASIFIDRENIAWICSEGGGLIKMAGTGFRVQIPGSNLNQKKIIYNVDYFPDTTWYFFEHQIIHRKIKTDLRKFISNLSTKVYLTGQKEGKLIVSDINYIYEANIPSQGKNYLIFKKIYGSTETDPIIIKNLVDPFGNIIFSSQFEILVVHDQQVIYKYPLPTSDLVEGIKVTGGNMLWVITRTSGLLAFRMQPDDLENYLVPLFKFKEEFKNYSPRSMGFDKNGVIWIGTRDHGILAFRFTGKELQKLKHFDTQKGLTDNFVTTIACDSSNNMLIGTQTGIDRLVAGINYEYRVENITKSNNVFGFISKLWVDKNGEAYALQNSGAILQLSPVQETVSTYKPELFIEEIKVNGILVPDIENIKRLRYNQQNLNFNVAAPTFIDEKQVKYSYRLSGNSEWSEPSSNANINLLNLTPGEYLLNVRAIFPSTSYSPKEISYAFSIAPPWWQTWWFRIILIFSGIGAIAWLVRTYYQTKLENQKIIFERQKAIEQERTRIAMEMHDDLGSGLTTIRYLAGGLSLDSSTGTKDKATKIENSAKELVDSMNDIIWTMKSDNNSLEEMLAYIRKQAAEQLENNAIEYNFDFPKELPEIKLSSEQKRNLLMISKEAVHNIVKHARASHVNLKAEAENGVFQLSFIDNGKGITKTEARHFGNGLKNMQRRAEEIGAWVDIKNSQGTTITVTIQV